MMHDVMLRLSSGVTATNMSASSAPASFRVLMLVGDPSIVIMSYSLSRPSSLSASSSTSVQSSWSRDMSRAK